MTSYLKEIAIFTFISTINLTLVSKGGKLADKDKYKNIERYFILFSSVQSLNCVLLCNPMDCSTPGLPIHHQLPEFTQTHVRWVSDAIWPSHPLSSPSPPALNLSHHQGLFKWVGSSHQVAKVLEFQLQHQSFQWIFRTDFLQDWLVCRPKDSRKSMLWLCTNLVRPGQFLLMRPARQGLELPMVGA